jgi:polysaccharide biosynthesis/export protein
MTLRRVPCNGGDSVIHPEQPTRSSCSAPAHAETPGAGGPFEEFCSECARWGEWAAAVSSVLELTRRCLNKGSGMRQLKRRVRGQPGAIAFIAALASLIIQFTVFAAAQQQPSETTAARVAAATTKPGAADGTLGPALTGVRRPLYRLRCSDVVEVTFTFSPDFNQVLTIQPDGFVPLKGAAQLYAEGLTVAELQAAIRNEYSGVLHDPEVTVVIKDFDKPYYVAAGEVGRPGKYELRASTTVTEAVAIAGGFTLRAKHSQVVLFRHISADRVESQVLNIKALLKSRDLNEDVQLRAGDVVFVPQNAISKIRQFLPASSLSLYANPTGF